MPERSLTLVGTPPLRLISSPRKVCATFVPIVPCTTFHFFLKLQMTALGKKQLVVWKAFLSDLHVLVGCGAGRLCSEAGRQQALVLLGI